MHLYAWRSGIVNVIYIIFFYVFAKATPIKKEINLGPLTSVELFYFSAAQ